MEKTEKIVVIGGGTGLFTVLSGLKKFIDANNTELVAIVAASDSGGSSGILKEEFGVLPFGDMRRCLVALSDSEKLMTDLLQYRFEEGSLKGHNLGNLLLLALTKMTGGEEKAIEEISRILAIKGKVLPCTLQNIILCAKLRNGKIIRGEDKVGSYKMYHNSMIEELFIEPANAEAYEKTVQEILSADKIILGPGSLYTSVIANLLVQGVREAIKKSKAKKIFIVNIMTQHGETDDFSASRHVEEISKYLGDVVDYVVINTSTPNKELLKRYEEEYKYQVQADIEGIKNINEKIKIVEGNFLRHTTLLRHDPLKLAQAIIAI